jgi:hypothetical protein
MEITLASNRQSMKAILTTILLTVTIGSSISSPLPISNQDKATPISTKSIVFEFGAIHVHRQQDGTGLQWQVSDNSIVEGFYIERSFDGTNYITVGDVAGAATTSWYRFRDADVFPGFINYRIVAVLNDGTEVTSAVQTVRIVSKK